MRIVFISNFFNHHQKPLADELYARTNGKFHFVSTENISEWRIQLGYKEPDASYIIKSIASTPSPDVLQMINDADVAIIGSAPYSYIAERAKAGKFIFTYGERIYKEGAPLYKVLIHWFRYGRQFRPYPNIYRLCASAFSPADYARTSTFVGKNFRWGYFTEAKEYADVKQLIAKKSVNELQPENEQGLRQRGVSILWVSRLIELKHPEVAISVAKRLKEDGVIFNLNMIGIGEMQESLELLISKNGLNGYVHLLGAMSPENVRRHMELSEIFLFTSDRNEGWGAVLNEAMNSACAIVASSAIGAVPFLVKNGENGFIYRDGDLDDLYRKVHQLIDDPSYRREMGEMAYHTIHDTWSPRNAAERLIILSENLMKGNTQELFTEGPCSPAPMLKDNWW